MNAHGAVEDDGVDVASADIGEVELIELEHVLDGLDGELNLRRGST